MDQPSGVKKIAVIGAGVIGMSWALFYLSKGFRVLAVDRDAAAESRMRAYVEDAAAVYREAGVSLPIDWSRLEFSQKIDESVSAADFVQENGPERLEAKQAIIQQLESRLRPEVIVASSSSGLKVSDFQQGARHPERILLGHPFNPPHLVPLVEVCGGKLTAPTCLDQALAFYRSLGKKPVLLRKEMTGHIANRLQGALLREVFYLLMENVASLADIDRALADGPGLRWALIGQFMNSNLGGGEGGIRHFLEHLGGPVESWWADLGRIEHITPEMIDKAAQGIDGELAGLGLRQENVQRARDLMLIKLVAEKASNTVLSKL